MAFKHFADYMFYLLTTPFKKIREATNQWYIFFSAIGPLFDEVKEDFGTARRESIVSTSSEDMLPIHAEERELYRFRGETIEAFRMRICTYGELCRLAGTNAGTQLAVESLGIKSVRSVPAYQIDKNRNRWAEFYIVITIGIDEMLVVPYSTIRQAVRKVKQSSAKDNYMVYLQCTGAKHEESFWLKQVAVIFSLKWLSNHQLDGSWKLDGSMLLNSVIMNNPLTITCCVDNPNETQMDMTYTEKYHWWTLDGTYKLDGTRKLDAAIIEEKL